MGGVWGVGDSWGRGRGWGQGQHVGGFLCERARGGWAGSVHVKEGEGVAQRVWVSAAIWRSCMCDCCVGTSVAFERERE